MKRDDAAKLDAIWCYVKALEARVEKLERRPARRVAALEAQVEALEHEAEMRRPSGPLINTTMGPQRR